VSTTIAANARLARQLQREHDRARLRQGDVVWESPSILSYDAWLRQSWQDCAARDPANTPVLLDSAQEEALWEEAIHASSDLGGLLNVVQTAGVAAQAWDLLHSWEALPALSGFEYYGDTDTFRGWLGAVQARLHDNGWITLRELPHALQDRWEANPGPRPTSVQLAGFDEVPPAANRLFRFLNAEVLPAPSLADGAVRIETHDAAEELTAAAWWARGRLEAVPDVSIGVVVRGLSGASQTVERIFDDVLHPTLSYHSSAARAFHVSAGTPTSEIPVIAAAFLMLGLTDSLTAPEAGMLLRSPFIKIEATARLSCDYEIRRYGIDPVPLDFEGIRRCFPHLAVAVSRMPELQRPGQWSATFSHLLREGGWLAERVLSSPEHQAVEHWKDLLSRFARLDLVLPRLTLPQALTRLRRIAARSRFAPADEDAPVQIMDVLEAGGSRFDALWVAGLHADAWPPPARPNPFLSLQMQRQLGMPHASPERELEFARTITHRLRGSSSDVVFSHPKTSGDETLFLSPLLKDLPAWDGPVPGGDTLLQTVFEAAVPVEEIALGNASVLPVGTPQRGGVKLLERQAACPFQAFAVYRLGAQELGEPPLGVSAMERGILAHKALEHLWNRLESKRHLDELTESQQDSLVEDCVQVALDDELSRREKSTGIGRFREIESARLCRLITEWLREEKARRPFQVTQSEKEEPAEVGGLSLAVRADRIDRYEDTGLLTILDYKTSKAVKEKNWDGERPDAPQLPLYAIARGSGVEEIAFARLVLGSVKWMNESKVRERAPEWRAVLEKLANDFREGRAEVNPKYGAETCRLCRRMALCRINESRLLDEAQDLEDGA